MRFLSVALLALPAVFAADDSGVSAAIAAYSNVPNNAAAQSAWLVSFLDNYSNVLGAEATNSDATATSEYTYPTSLDSSLMAIIDSITAKDSAAAASVSDAADSIASSVSDEASKIAASRSDAESAADSATASSTASDALSSDSASSLSSAGAGTPVLVMGTFMAMLAPILL